MGLVHNTMKPDYEFLHTSNDWCVKFDDDVIEELKKTTTIPSLKNLDLKEMKVSDEKEIDIDFSFRDSMSAEEWQRLIDYNSLSIDMHLKYIPIRIPRIAKKAVKVVYKRNTKGKRLLEKIKAHYPSYRLKNCNVVPEKQTEDVMKSEYTIHCDNLEKE